MAATALLALLLAQGPSSPAPRCAGPAYRQFDFWVGEWIVHNRKGEQVGTSRVEKIEDDCGIRENWRNARGITGQSTNVYRPASRTWVQVWAGSDGLTLVLEGTFDGQKMILEGESLGAKGERLHNRVTWSVQDAVKVRQLWEQSSDGGRTWTVAFDGVYTPKS
jgi:hypothetical protein